MPEGLGARTFRAALWLYALQFFDRILGIAATVILARILEPRHFGIVAIATLVIRLLEVFSRSGLQQSLIHQRIVTDHELDAVWTAQALIRGPGLSLLIFLSAPWVGGFFNSPESVPILRAMAVIPILMFGLSRDYVLLIKELEIKNARRIDLTGSLARAILGVGLAVQYRSVWPLAVAEIGYHLVRLVASYAFLRTRPRLVWDPPVVLHHFKYGRQIMATAITQYAYRNIDRIFIGRVIGESALGLYSKAYQLGNLPTTQLTKALQRVLFPSFAKMNEDIARLRSAFVRVLRSLAVLVAPLTVALFLFAEAIVGVVLGEQWLSMVPAFRVLVLWGGFRAFYTPAESLFRAVGRPGVIAATTLTKTLLLAALLWPALVYGITGVAWAVLLTALLELPVLLYLTARALSAPIGMLVGSLLPATAVATLCGTAAWVLVREAGWSVQLVGATLMGAIYLGILYSMDRWLGSENLSEFRRHWGALRPQREHLESVR